MSPLDIIVCAHELAVNTPIFGREHRALDPLIVDVTDRVLEGLRSEPEDGGAGTLGGFHGGAGTAGSLNFLM